MANINLTILKTAGDSRYIESSFLVVTLHYDFD